ncbi:hypothetical protein EVJ58_g8451 [Rhodofomes roseus]|uniref:DNA 3'-5' helicase n=1 Tax=Rhodofomes roseus TaxID=34475 RepID=A0A4Y9XXX9_9APHY|nr:hypothetical protein EVJ58_g8451 [Rhodofomes roseus]
MPVASRILQPPPIHCQSSNLKFDDALTIARAAAHKSRGYDSEGTRQKIKELSVEAFGGKEPYGWQVDVCEAILLGLDCIVIAGTGAGKTVPFAMPLLLDETKKKLVVVISPLNELERDQAERFRTMGLTATAINKEEYSDRLHKEIERGEYRMLLTGPEMALEHKRFSKLLRSPSFAKNIAAIVIDEAHCISQWGDSFRKKYAELGRLRALVPMSVPFLATSATLPPAALADVQAKLSFHLNSTFFVNLGNDRTNITPLVVQMKGGAGDLAALDFAVREALAGDPLVKTLIFFNTRELAMRACHHLKTLLPDAYKGKIDFLHALRGDDTKREVMQRFRNDELSILCATEAAGMGLDISNIRRVIQFMVPTSLSQWFQRYGRAGRDGLPAVAILLVEQSVFKKVKPRGVAREANEVKREANEDHVEAEDLDVEDGAENDGDNDLGVQPAESTKDSVDNNDTKVFQKQVECGLRTWLEAPDCRRTVANAYFNNPRNEREAEDNMLKLLKSIRLRETGDRLVESAVKIEESEPGLAGAATGKRPAARQKERFKYVYNAALAWRRLCWRRDYSICVWGPEALLSDKTASKIVRATAIQTLGDLTTSVPEWCFAKKHGEELLQTILSADEEYKKLNEQAKVQRRLNKRAAKQALPLALPPVSSHVPPLLSPAAALPLVAPLVFAPPLAAPPRVARLAPPAFVPSVFVPSPSAPPAFVQPLVAPPPFASPFIAPPAVAPPQLLSSRPLAYPTHYSAPTHFSPYPQPHLYYQAFQSRTVNITNWRACRG